MNSKNCSPASPPTQINPTRLRALRAILAGIVELMRSDAGVDDESIDALASAARILDPAHPDLVSLHALLLVKVGMLARAEEVALDNTHPVSRAVLALCAVAKGDLGWRQMANDLLTTEHPEALEIASSLLASGEESNKRFDTNCDFRLFHCRC